MNLMFLKRFSIFFLICFLICSRSEGSDKTDFVRQFPVPWWEGPAGHSFKDSQGNEWGIFQLALSDARDFSKYRPMVWATNQWAGPTAMYDQPSYSKGELTGSRNGAYTAGLVFTPKEVGRYSWSGTIGFQSSIGNTYLEILKLDHQQGETLYSGWHGKGTSLNLSSLPALQNVELRAVGKIIMLVTGEAGQFGKVSLNDAGIVEEKVLRLSSGPDDFTRRNTTATRNMICLNGRWDWQPGSGTLYNPFTNTDLFPKPDSPLPVPNTNVRPPSPNWDKKLVPNHPPHPYNCKRAKDWFRRTFFVPKEWEGRRVELTFMGAGFEIIAFVNGKCVGWHLGDVTGFSLDLTDTVKYGQENELLLSVWWHSAFYGEVWPQGLIETIWSRRTGVWDDVFLRSRPKVSVETVFCKPSFRKKELSVDVTVENATQMPSEVTVESVVLDREGKEVLKLDSTKVTAGPEKQVTTRLARSWPEPHLWWPHDPYLYYLETRLLQGGKVIDVLRERFGFKEAWIEGRDFYVNGKIHHFHGITHDPGTGRVSDQNYAWIRALLRQYKAAGYTMVRTFAKPSYIFMEAADEVGIYLKVQSGWHHSNNQLTAEFKKNAGRTVKDWIVRDRNHPSIVMWDASNEPDAQYESVYWVMDEIRKYDPTRAIDVDRSYGVSIYDGQGNPKMIDNYNVEHKQYGLGRFEIANPHYPIICGLPCYSVLTAAEYPARWMGLGKIPLFFGEWGDFNNPGRTTRGPDHYKDISELRELVWGHGFEFSPEGWLSYLEEIMPHWRRFKVSGYDEWLSHTSESWLFAPMGKNNYPVDPTKTLIPVVWDRLDTPGIKFENVFYPDCRVNPGWFPDLPEWTMDDKWQRYSRIWKPRFAFFHDKTRAVYAGRAFSRSVTLINDTLADTVMEGTVALTVDGKTALAIPFKAEVKQGQVRDVPINFDLPKVDRRTAARVTITFKKESENDQSTRPLDLDLFPSTRPAAVRGIALYDPKGDTAKAFYKLGLEFRRIRNPEDLGLGTTVFVIGENGLDNKVLAGANKITSFVEKGGAVVCLAQDEWQDWLPVKIRQNRDLEESLVYILSEDHSLFKGLRSTDFSWWPNNRNRKFKVPGAVVDKPFFKPLKGPVRSLLECGTLLDLSGLLEIKHGEGTFFLTQLKLVPVIGESPVADIMLERLVTKPVSNLPVRKVWFAGDDISRAMLTDRLGAEITDLQKAGEYQFTNNDLIVWIPNEKAVDPSIAKTAARGIKQGAALLAVAGAEKLLPPINDPPVFGDAMQYKGRVYILQESKPDGWVAPDGRFIKMALVDRNEPLIDGISNAEMSRSHYRGGTFKLADYEIEAKNGWRQATRPGVIGVRSVGNSPQVICTAVRNGPTGEITKYEQTIHSLLLNLGGIHRGQYKPKRVNSFDNTGKFFSVDLRQYCNMGFIDEVAGDGKGGWGDQGPQCDLRTFSVGPQKFLDIPFDVIDPKTNGGKSCITLGSAMLKALPREMKGIDFGHRKAKRIYFLHSMTWAPMEGVMGEYCIRYGKALEMKQTIVLVSGKNIADWWRPADLEEARVAWRGENARSTVGVYLYVWENPHPDTVIDEIDFSGKHENAIMHLIAITGQE
jgi:hypothetical protein